MVLGPVSYPAEVHSTTVSALQNGKFSRLGGEPPPYPPKFRPCEGTDFHLSAQLLTSRGVVHLLDLDAYLCSLYVNSDSKKRKFTC